jgi:hypothetical protein
MEYIVKKIEAPKMPEIPDRPVMPEQYVLVYTKTIQDVNGKDVTVVDHEERVSVEQLTVQKAALQSQMDEADKKIAAIKNLQKSK